MPLGVDSTACFVEAQQRDRAVAGANAAGMPLPPGVGASESELRLQYALAVVRMVNGIADSSQRGRVAASVASLSAAAGELRNLHSPLTSALLEGCDRLQAYFSSPKRDLSSLPLRATSHHLPPSLLPLLPGRLASHSGRSPPRIDTQRAALSGGTQVRSLLLMCMLPARWRAWRSPCN